jgi:hypothetical protein
MSFEQMVEEYVVIIGPYNGEGSHIVSFNFPGCRYPFHLTFSTKEKADKVCRQMREWLNDLLNDEFS